MGRNSSNRKKNILRQHRKIPNSVPAIKSLSIESLLKEAQIKIDAFQYKEAQTYCKEVLARKPDHVSALELSGQLCIEVKNLEGAKHCYGRAIHLQPEEGYTKYMAMAQLMDGKESVQCYLKGIQLIQKLLNQEILSKQGQPSSNVIARNEEASEAAKENNSRDGNVGDTSKDRESTDGQDATSSLSFNNDVEQSSSTSLNRQISSAYCSLSELYMTDLCDEDDAESNCTKYSKLAIDSDPLNPESYQQMANFLLVKQDLVEAKNFMKKSVELWLPKYLAVDKGEAEGGSFDPIEVCSLSYDARLSSARILIELDEHETASEVLECLVGEDDENVETWYLLGLNSYLRGEDHYNNARENFVKALEVDKINPSNDDQVIPHIEELMTEIGSLEEMDEEALEDDDPLLDSDDETMECS